MSGTRSPPAKRRRRNDSTPSDMSKLEADGNDEDIYAPGFTDNTIYETTSKEGGLENPPLDNEAGLESSLPNIKADDETISEYRSWKACEVKETEAAGAQQRIDNREWVKGRSSIYVDAFNFTLEFVLADEAHLFSAAEMALFDYWKGLCYESQYLYVRLFLRKTSAWHRVNRLGYYDDISDLPGSITDLRKVRELPRPSNDSESNPSGLETPPTVNLGDEFRFAEGLEEITSLEETLSLLLLDELKTFAKEAKVQGKNKKELLKALRESSENQTELEWFSSSKDRYCGANSVHSTVSVSQSGARDGFFMNKALGLTGDCVRLTAGPLKLFERKNYPNYIVSRSTAIFPTRSALLEFEAALRIQFDLDSVMESKSSTIIEKLTTVKELSDSVYSRWRTLLKEEQLKEERVYDYGEGAYLRRFSPAWVYTRIIHKGLNSHGRFKDYNREHELLTELLDQRLFHTARRGAWYIRKALIEERYMWALRPEHGRSEDVQKREAKRRALRTCEEGLEDPDCHLSFHYDLQKRITKLEKSLNTPKREQHDFSHLMLAKPEERTVEGIRVEKELPIKPAAKTNGTSIRGRPTTWIDEMEDGGECRVESMCLSWYRSQGWKGYHCESGILRTLFGYLFYDILFIYVPNVFQTPYQTCPLDLHTDSFYSARLSEINHRLAQISNGEAQDLIRQVYERESEKQTCAIGIDWSFELDDITEIVQCFRGESLATICKVMAQEYQQRGGGIPDLFLWRTDTKEVMFSEVKSENDRLSDTQRLWIHVLTGAGVKVELCNAVAREVRYVS